jgi:hypothetical protein
VAEPKKHSTPPDPDPFFLVEWMPYLEAVRHVRAWAARHGIGDTERELPVLKEWVVGLSPMIESIGRLDLPDGEIKPLTREDRKRLASAGAFDTRFSSDPWGAYCVSLRRYQVYRLWAYSERQERENGPLECSETYDVRCVWAAKRAAWECVMGGRPGAPPMPAELAVLQATPTVLPATKPEDIRDLEWAAARAVMELRRRGDWPRKQQSVQLETLNSYLKNIRADTVSKSTMKNALAWLRKNGWQN